MFLWIFAIALVSIGLWVTKLPESARRTHKRDSKRLPRSSRGLLKRRYRGKKSIPENIDVIVVGGGVSGMGTAALLAKAGKRVLVLEQNESLGGGAHTFSDKKGLEHHTGVHYLGKEMVDVVKRFGENDKPMEWTSYSHYDSFWIGDLKKGTKVKVNLTSPERGVKPSEHYKKTLLDALDVKSRKRSSLLLEKFCKRVDSIKQQGRLYFTVETFRPDGVPWLGKIKNVIQERLCPDYVWGLHTTLKEALLQMGFEPGKDDILMALIGSQYGDHGEPPERAPFSMHSAIISHYWEGAVYPNGGSSEIIRQMVYPILKTGGDALVRASVQHVIVKQSKVVGVVMEDGEVIKAPVVVSSVGAYNEFVGTDERPALFDGHHKWSKRCKDMIISLGQPSVRMTFLFVTINAKDGNKLPDCCKTQRQNTWIYPDSDLDRLHKTVMESKTPDVDSMPLFVAMGSAKDGSWSKEVATASVICLSPWTWTEKWQNMDHEERASNQDYAAYKNDLAKGMMKKLTMVFPDLEGCNLTGEVGTPLSTRDYLAAMRGECYGLAPSRNRNRSKYRELASIDTPYQGLYRTGQDVCTLGVAGALGAAEMTATKVLGIDGWSALRYRL